MQFVDPKLPKQISGWFSHRLDLEMPIVSYGDRGHPLLLLPTAQADFLENERFFLVKAIEPYILAGKVRVFSIDSINKDRTTAPPTTMPLSSVGNLTFQTASAAPPTTQAIKAYIISLVMARSIE